MDMPTIDSGVREDTYFAAEKAITNLCNAIQSSEEETVQVVAKLKKVVQISQLDIILDSNYGSSWDVIREAGFNEENVCIPGRVMSVQEGGIVMFQNNFHLILAAFNVIESGRRGFQQFMNKVDKLYGKLKKSKFNNKSLWQVGIMICEILFYPDVQQLAKKFLIQESLIEFRRMVIQRLKNELCNKSHEKLLLVVHMIASCGSCMKDAVPDEIAELDFSNVRLEVGNIIALVYVMSHCTRIGRLSMSLCNVTANCVNELQIRLFKFNLKISAVDFSRNENMGVEGLSHIGAIAKQHRVDKLNLSRCRLKAMEVESFNKAAGDAKISEIDFSGNHEMGLPGLTHVGAIAKQHLVDKLGLCWCGLIADEIESFHKGAVEAKITEIDFSGNENMDVAGLAFIGAIAHQHEVDKLNLSGCGLKAREVESFKMTAQDARVIFLVIDFLRQRFVLCLS